MRGGRSSTLVDGSDVKLLVLSFPYVLFGIVVQVFTIGAADDTFMTELLAYFLCEQPGAGPCDRAFEQHTYPDMFVTLYVVMTTIPLAHTVLILTSWREIKSAVANQCVTQSPLPNSPSVNDSLGPVPANQSTPAAAAESAVPNVDPYGNRQGSSDAFFPNVSRPKPDYHNLIIQDEPPSSLSMKTQSSYAYSDVLF